MAKNPGKIRTFEEIIADDKPKDLHQCPCSPACKCCMEYPCLGCETYSEWLSERTD